MNNSQQKYPLIVEVVGLAGAGKTTLSKALSELDKNILVADDIELHQIRHIPVFITHASLLLPRLIRPFRNSRFFTWDEIKAMVYLMGWIRMLGQQVINSHTVILLDHGPVFKLATLNAFGPDLLKGKGFKDWWDRMFALWAQTLDMVIWLNAPEHVLIERINNRQQRHAVKGKSKQEAQDFLSRYQVSYQHVLKELTAFDQLKVHSFETGRAEVGQLAENILPAFR